MKGTALRYRARGGLDGWDFSRPVTLDELQGWVGGIIEVVPAWTEHRGKPCVVFCNEEGKLRVPPLPENQAANYFWRQEQMRQGIRIDDVLVGDIVIVQGDQAFMDEL